MRFRPFRRRQRRSPQSDDGAAPSDWCDSGVADEVEAFVEGRLADRIRAQGNSVPAWVALNRLAHADHKTLVQLVEGKGQKQLTPIRPVHPWVEQERFIAAHLLATSGATPEALDRIQQQALVPLELSLIERSRTERLSPEKVLDAGREALDSYRTGA
jgi:hypothetical protein